MRSPIVNFSSNTTLGWWIRKKAVHWAISDHIPVCIPNLLSHTQHSERRNNISMLVRVAIFFHSQLVRSMASGQTGQTGLPVQSHVEEAKWLAQGVATILLPRGVERNVQERIQKLRLTVNLLARVSHYVVYNVITQILRQNFFFLKYSVGWFTKKKTTLWKIN